MKAVPLTAAEVSVCGADEEASVPGAPAHPVNRMHAMISQTSFFMYTPSLSVYFNPDYTSGIYNS
jgi:hypothetical protein